MKILVQAKKMSSTIEALKGERWEYLVMLGISIALIFICLVSLIFNSYQLVYTVLTSNQDIDRLSRLHETIKLSSIKPIVNNDTNQWTLFGVPPVVLKNSHFILLGTQYSQKNPIAIIGSDENKKGDIYRVGDKLPEGAIVNSIGKDYVELLYNGATEKIYIKWKQLPQP